jgi:hypothetical protein
LTTEPEQPDPDESWYIVEDMPPQTIPEGVTTATPEEVNLLERMVPVLDGEGWEAADLASIPFECIEAGEATILDARVRMFRFDWRKPEQERAFLDYASQHGWKYVEDEDIQEMAFVSESEATLQFIKESISDNY